jgi:hypothetical protein
MAYAGPTHLASLFLSAADAIEHAALTKLPPPEGADAEFWTKWLGVRAKDMPFVCQNHREAIEKESDQTGKSDRLFRRGDGAKVIVATPTLAQGLNLPTHLVVLTGDKRAGETCA